MSSSAPKFASFRPKPKATEQPLPAASRQEEKGTGKHNSSREKLSGDRRRSPPREKGKPAREGSSTKAYFSDRRGDLDIVRYGTLNRYDIPSYRRSGYGNVLGLPGQKIDREHSTDKKLYFIPLVPQRQRRTLTDKHAARESRHSLRLVRRAEDHHTEATHDFIALSGAVKRNRGSDSASEDNDDRFDVDYRGISEKPRSNQLDEVDTYYESDTEAAIASSEITQKNSRLIRETRDDPGNLQAWLDLIEHQEQMMRLDRAILDLSAADRQHLADVRISTYEEALRKIGDDEVSQVELQCGLLREAKQHWDDAKVALKWQDVLTRHPQNVKVWLRYLDFAQSTFSRFKFEDCRAIFSKALEALRLTASGDETTPAEVRLHLLVRLTTMIQQAGYQELALASWQALLEFNLLAPHDLAADKMQQFEEFWESEAPRIGEPNCRGWRHTSVDDAVPPACSVILDTFGSSDAPLDAFQKRERDSIRHLRYPGRSTDEVGEDDPFHTIFFSDLKDIVTSLPDAPVALPLDAFLCFCGLPPLVWQGTGVPWRHDPFLQSRTLDLEGATEVQSDGLQFQEALTRYFQTPFPRFQMTRDILVQQTFSLHNSKLSAEFIHNILKLLITNTADNELLGEYLLAFESRHFPSNISKSAKRLLKDKSSSIRLYNMYGLVEGHLGNSAKADQIFAAALNIKSASLDRLELLSSYVWQVLQRNDREEALRRLIHFKVNSLHEPSTKPDPSSIEIAQAAFQESLEQALLDKSYASAVTTTSHLALLVYLSSECNATAALEVHHHLNAWFVSHKLSSSAYAELHAQAIARLLAYHVTHASIVKPAMIRTALEPLIATFPDNTRLLSTYAANEARFSIDDRLRGNMHRILNLAPTSSATTWAFAVHHETMKSEIAGSTSHSIRALFKRATAPDASAAHCSALWGMYVHFELEQLHKEQTLRPNKRPRRDGKMSKWETRVEESGERVKETFYQGLKMLPWCKDFIMLAFTDAKGVFSDEELWRLYRVMLEKELRVYTEVDEQTG